MARCPSCSRNAQGLSVWLADFSGLSGSSDEVFGPANQTNETDKIDQMDQISFDARSGRANSPLNYGRAIN